jgi:hypothetical protein
MTKRILPLFLLFFATLPCARAQPDVSQACDGTRLTTECRQS